MSDFSAILLEWYAGHKRELPWRETRDPYRIWISEIILQQTRVAQGYEYFLRFVERFPDVSSLAEADEDEVMKYWQGLGYYSRARNLHAAARSMNGHFPQTYEGVRALKGVGDYTAAAICSIAYDMPYAVVDGNVYRVLLRKAKRCLPPWRRRCSTSVIRPCTIRPLWISAPSSVRPRRLPACFVLWPTAARRWLRGACPRCR